MQEVGGSIPPGSTDKINILCLCGSVTPALGTCIGTSGDVQTLPQCPHPAGVSAPPALYNDAGKSIGR